MHAVVNKMILSRQLDDELLRQLEDELAPRMRAEAGFAGAKIVRVSDTEAIFLVYFTTREELERISRDVAAPWFAERVRPYLGGPVQRSVGEVAWSVGRA